MVGSYIHFGRCASNGKMNLRSKSIALLVISVALVALYFLHVYNSGFTPVARKVFWEQVDHSKGTSRQLRTPKGFDAITGYRLTPICAWDNVNGEIPSLDPNPKVLLRSVFLDDFFFVPHVNQHETLHYYIENWCRIGSCHFEWLQFHPDCGLKH